MLVSGMCCTRKYEIWCTQLLNVSKSLKFQRSNHIEDICWKFDETVNLIKIWPGFYFSHLGLSNCKESKTGNELLIMIITLKAERLVYYKKLLRAYMEIRKVRGFGAIIERLVWCDVKFKDNCGNCDKNIWLRVFEGKTSLLLKILAYLHTTMCMLMGLKIN